MLQSLLSIQILDGEHLNEFYSHTQELAREITIVNLPDGNAAESYEVVPSPSGL